MIHLPRKDNDAPPARLVCANALTQLRNAVLHQDGERYTTTYYRDDTVTELLRPYSIDKLTLELRDWPKCNYCESQVEKAVTLQVEHYRPKAKVDPKDTGGAAHTGYYWLGIEWSNLLLACPQCNGPSAKHNRFPIRGVRATAPVLFDAQGNLDRSNCHADQNPLLAEDPILLNPEIDHPENFLTFDTQANMSGQGPDAERGEKSKDIYNLNRPLLVQDRLEVWTVFKDDILIDIGEHMMGEISEETLRYAFKNICRKILKRSGAGEEFALWGRYINDHLEDFIGVDITDNYYRDLFRNAYYAAIGAGVAVAAVAP
jgi:5-methylcytosine-specific restriction endonuclease McrA